VQSLNGDKRNGVSEDEDDNARVDVSEGGQVNSETIEQLVEPIVLPVYQKQQTMGQLFFVEVRRSKKLAIKMFSRTVIF
jgi:hypothetical protein